MYEDFLPIYEQKFGENHPKTEKVQKNLERIAEKLGQPLDSSSGRKLGNYRLLKPLGAGGFGDVYLGERIDAPEKKVAVKMLKPTHLTNSEIVKEFREEAGNLLRLKHEHIVNVEEVGTTEDNAPYLVMEYAPNGTLRDVHPKNTRVPLWKVVKYVNQIASALQYMHDEKLMHMDLKPENVLIGAEGQLLLSDFGLVQTVHDTVSQPTLNMGTCEYAAPEHFHYGKPCKESDQYSLGVMVYEWLSGKRPFFLHAPHPDHNVRFEPLHGGGQGISRKIEQVVFKALKAKPKDRFTVKRNTGERIPSVKAFAEAFEQACKELFKSSKFLKSSEGIDFLKSSEGIDFLKSGEGIGFLKSREGIGFLKSREGIDFLKSREGIGFLKSQEGIDFLKSREGIGFLKSQEGIDFLEESPAVREILESSIGSANKQEVREQVTPPRFGEEGYLTYHRQAEQLQTVQGSNSNVQETHHGIKEQKGFIGQMWQIMRRRNGSAEKQDGQVQEQVTPTDRVLREEGSSSQPDGGEGIAKSSRLSLPKFGEWDLPKFDEWREEGLTKREGTNRHAEQQLLDHWKKLGYRPDDAIWLASKDGREFLEKHIREFVETSYGKQYMKRYVHELLETEAGKAWAEKGGLAEWIKSDTGKEYMKRYAHELLETEVGRVWEEKGGLTEWIKSDTGKEYIKHHAHELLGMVPVRAWAEKGGLAEWIKSDTGKEYMRLHAYRLLEKEEGITWAKKGGLAEWLKSDVGKEYMKHHAHELLMTVPGRAWAKKGDLDAWLQSKDGMDYMERYAHELLVTEAGKAWAERGGLAKWLRSYTGKFQKLLSVTISDNREQLNQLIALKAKDISSNLYSREYFEEALREIEDFIKFFIGDHHSDSD